MMTKAFLSTAAQATAKKPRNWLLWIGVPTSAIAIGSTYSYVTYKPVVKAVPYVPALDGNWKRYTVKEVHELNHNVKKLVFALPEGATELGLPVAGSVVSKFKPDGAEKAVIRPYTPVVHDDHGSASSSKTFDLVVKVYKDGNMSKHIGSLKPGDELEIKGPNLKYAYEANKEGHLGLIAGGSGLTPMYQILQKIALNPNDQTKVDLIFANVEEKDIFLKKKLNSYAAMKPDQIKIHYVLEKPPKEWNGPSGYVDASLLEKILPGPTKQGKVFVCGPPPMVSALAGPKAKDYTQGELSGALKKLGYTSEQVFKF